MRASGRAWTPKYITTGAACTQLPEQSPSSARYRRVVHEAHAVMLAMASASRRPPATHDWDAVSQCTPNYSDILPRHSMRAPCEPAWQKLPTQRCTKAAR